MDQVMKMPRRRDWGVVAATGTVCAVLVGCSVSSMRLPEAPRAALEVIAAPAPTPEATTDSTTAVTLSGNATWYRWHSGEAAAGPLLRQALGKHWRGMTVTVCRGECIHVKLTDWCLCANGRRLIDLDYRSFDALGSLSEGVIVVRIVIGQAQAPEPDPTGPPTDIEGD